MRWIIILLLMISLVHAQVDPDEALYNELSENPDEDYIWRNPETVSILLNERGTFPKDNDLAQIFFSNPQNVRNNQDLAQRYIDSNIGEEFLDDPENLEIAQEFYSQPGNILTNTESASQYLSYVAEADIDITEGAVEFDGIGIRNPPSEVWILIGGPQFKGMTIKAIPKDQGGGFTFNKGSSQGSFALVTKDSKNLGVIKLGDGDTRVIFTKYKNKIIMSPGTQISTSLEGPNNNFLTRSIAGMTTLTLDSAIINVKGNAEILHAQYSIRTQGEVDILTYQYNGLDSNFISLDTNSELKEIFDKKENENPDTIERFVVVGDGTATVRIIPDSTGKNLHYDIEGFDFMARDIHGALIRSNDGQAHAQLDIPNSQTIIENCYVIDEEDIMVPHETNQIGNEMIMDYSTEGESALYPGMGLTKELHVLGDGVSIQGQGFLTYSAIKARDFVEQSLSRLQPIDVIVNDDQTTYMSYNVEEAFARVYEDLKENSVEYALMASIPAAVNELELKNSYTVGGSDFGAGMVFQPRINDYGEVDDFYNSAYAYFNIGENYFTGSGEGLQFFRGDDRTKSIVFAEANMDIYTYEPHGSVSFQKNDWRLTYAYNSLPPELKDVGLNPNVVNAIGLSKTVSDEKSSLTTYFTILNLEDQNKVELGITGTFDLENGWDILKKKFNLR